jgi:hypothetical protein
MMTLRPGSVVTAATMVLAVLLAGVFALAAADGDISVPLIDTWPDACVPALMDPPAVVVAPGTVHIHTYSPGPPPCAPVPTPFALKVSLPITSSEPWTAYWYHFDGVSFVKQEWAFAFDVTPCPFRPERGAMECGPDVGGTGRTALNFTGKAGPAGDTWIALYDQFPDDGVVDDDYGSVTLEADLLISTYNNKKGVGLLALYDEKTGLALIMYDNGNTDTLALGTVDARYPGKGKFTPLRYPGTTKLVTVSLCGVQPLPGAPCRGREAAILEDQWYRLSVRVTVTGRDVKVDNVTVQRLSDGGEVFQVPAPLTYEARLPDWLAEKGQVGAVGSAFSAAVDSGVSGFAVTPE